MNEQMKEKAFLDLVKQENANHEEQVEEALPENAQEESPSEQQGEHKEHHHHHHHHHHSHHHKRRKHRSHKSSRTKRKVKRFFRHNKHKLVNIVACTVAVSMLLVVAIRGNFWSNDEPTTQVLSQVAIHIESSLYIDTVPLVNEAILEYMDPSNTKTSNEVYKAYEGFNQQLNVGLPVEYSYMVTGLPANVSVEKGVLEVSEYNNYSNPRTFDVVGSNGVVEMYHLKVNTKYFYRLTLTLNNGSVTGTIGEFTTAKSPRILAINGIQNVRDVGGWKMANGKTVKQGLLYRGTELDGVDKEANYRLSASGSTDMVKTLGIRYDMDLRDSSSNQNRVDALGDAIPHKYYGAQMYSDALKAENNEIMRRIFSDLAVEANYPIYMHCTHGRDRTGTVCYLLDGLLGVSQKDAYKDYALSAFTDSYLPDDDFKSFELAIETLPGNTFQEKVEGYLLSVGVTAQEIQNIRTIFLGE